MAELPRIAAIAPGDIRRIAGAQVIPDLRASVKELIENALDAGATSVGTCVRLTAEVRFRGHGLESVEVVDNGSGIAKSNYASIGRRHHTSKLASFEDLENVATYGFRGEAIASLCSVADVRFLTATESEAPMGTVIELDHAGQVRDASQRVARQVRDSLTQRGTTVTITNLLSSLPVRRRELERHIKREYGKAHAMLQAYALITQGVRWSSCVILPDGRRTSQLLVSASSGPDYLLSNFRALFGAKAAAGMQRLELPGASETDATLRGLVSKPILGHGRSSGDRQYFYVNGRPWDSPKLAQIFNQVYKMFNATQYPSVVANLELPPSAYDVNVAPDKRSIYLHDESALLTHWQDALHAVFAPSRGVLAVHGPVPVVQDAPAELPDAASGSRAEEPPATVPRRRAVDMEVVSTHSASWSSPPRRPAASAAQREDGMQSQFRRAVAHFAALTAGAPCAEASPPAKRARAALEYRESEGEEGSSDNSDELGAISHRPRDAECVSERHDNSGNAIDMDDEDHDGLEQVVDTTKDARLNTSSSAADDVKFAGEPCRSGAAAESLFLANPSSSSDSTGSPEVHARMETEDAPRQVPDASSAPGTQTVSSEQDELESSGEADHDFCEPTPSVGTRVRPPRLAVRENESGASLPTPLVLPATPVSPRRVRAPADTRSRTPTPSPPMAPPTPGPCTTVALDMAVLRAHSQQRARRLHAPQAWEGADVHRPDADAVAALERVIVKSDFTQMQIVGQFNLGFILARRTTSDMDDLFIIDQHAADEKYNFEALQTSTRIHSQRLLQPQRISLAPSDELVAREHAEWLRMNGFEVDIDEDAAPGSRVLLLAKPVSKGVVFDVHDLEELLFQLREAPTGHARYARCSKVHDMLASRACRKSIMVGAALDRRQMQRVVRHMSETDQPWNCPHGRPTMRHLITLSARPRERAVAWDAVARLPRRT